MNDFHEYNDLVVKQDEAFAAEWGEDFSFPVWLKWFDDKTDAVNCVGYLRRKYCHLRLDESIYLDETSTHKPGGKRLAAERLCREVAEWYGVPEVKHGS